MSPIDDELRAALHGRAAGLSPAPDPLAGIERRARRMQRHRIGAAVAGSAMAVAAIALAVPALQDSTAAPGPRPPMVASAEPTPTLAPAPVSYALDPTDPWAFRGVEVDEGTRAAVQREYATRVQGSEVRVTPLFAQVWEPSQQLEVVFLAEVDGAHRWGVAATTESGPEFLWDEELLPSTSTLLAALPGDEGVARLLVVASPDTVSINYVPDEASEPSATGELARGVATVALDGDPETDSVEVVWPETFLVQPAPDLPADQQPQDEGPGTETPVNLLDWPSRGTELDPDLEAALLDAYAAAVSGLDGEPLHTGVFYRPLFSGSTDGGVRFTVGQAWAAGREAHSVSLAVGGTAGDQFHLGPVTDPDTRVVAQVLCCQPGATVDTLVVVPVPGTGQVLYDDDDTGEFRPVGQGQDFLDGPVLVDRTPTADRDRLQLLDGDGDAARPLFQGPVASLLCGLRECG